MLTHLVGYRMLISTLIGPEVWQWDQLMHTYTHVHTDIQSSSLSVDFFKGTSRKSNGLVITAYSEMRHTMQYIQKYKIREYVHTCIHMCIHVHTCMHPQLM